MLEKQKCNKTADSKLITNLPWYSPNQWINHSTTWVSWTLPSVLPPVTHTTGQGTPSSLTNHSSIQQGTHSPRRVSWYFFQYSSSPAFWAPVVAQIVKHLPAMWETWVQSLGWEDPLEKFMATHSSILAWRIPWTEEPDRLQSTGLKKPDTTQRLNHHHNEHKLS